MFVVVALAFVVVLVWRQWTSLGEMVTDFRALGWSPRPGWILAALALATANLFLMGTAWVSLFRQAGGSMRTSDGIRVWLITNLGRYIPGKVWQLAGLTVYIRGLGGSAGAALASAVQFQVLLLVTGAVAALATVGVQLTGAALTWGAAWVIAALVPLLHPRVAAWLTRRLARLLGDPEEIVPERWSRRSLVGVTGLLLVAWLAYGVGLTWLARGLGVGAASPGSVVATGAFAAAYVIGYLALVAPGGLIVREGALAGLLSAVAVMPLAVSATIAVAARLWVTASELLALAVAVWLVRAEDGPRADRSTGATAGGSSAT